jgi:DNA replication and repair protein RecF
MHLKRLLLRNFRNYLQNEVFFSPSINLFQGENGQGKTNLLEAIYLVSTGRSFRTHTLSDLIAFGKRFFYLEAEFSRDGISQTLKIYYDEQGRKVEHNGNTYSTLHSLLGILPSVLITPDDLSLINGSPSERRRFLDLHSAQIDPSYVHHLGRYFKAMKQRNHLLRTPSQAGIAAWEEVMALSASYIVDKRKNAVLELAPHLNKWIELLSKGADPLTLHYHSNPSSLHEEQNKALVLQQAFKEMRPKETLIGNTLVGPHRDDLLIQLGKKLAKAFSSEGQKRSCLSALRFAEWEHMAQLLDDKPLLGIDDFGIQLDPERHEQLQSHLAHFGQVFLTSPLFVQEGLEACHTFTIKKGEIQETCSKNKIF